MRRAGLVALASFDADVLYLISSMANNMLCIVPFNAPYLTLSICLTLFNIYFAADPMLDDIEYGHCVHITLRSRGNCLSQHTEKHLLAAA